MRIMASLLAVLISTHISVASADTVTINSSSLRQMYLGRNIDLQMSLNSVQRAKTEVSMARAALLPSVNLGGIISGGPSFMLSTVSFLFPFLMPQNWMNLKESMYLLEAQTMSHYIAQLNGYASAYALYTTISSDMRLRSALNDQYKNFKLLEDSLKLPAEMGIIRKEDYLQAQAQASLARVQVSQVDELLKRSKASLRQMLGLRLSTKIRIETESIPSSSSEGSSASSVLRKLEGRTPEIGQLIWLLNAANANKWSKTFNFLNNVTLTSARSGGGQFASITQGQVSWGPGYFPAIQMSNVNRDLIQLQMQDVNQEKAMVIESTLASVEQAKIQFEYADMAENNLRTVYESEKKRYEAGLIDIQLVVNAGNAITQAVVSRIEALNNLGNARINLHRMLITGQFSKIPYCRLKKVQKGVFQTRRGQVVKASDGQYRLEDLCR